MRSSPSTPIRFPRSSSSPSDWTSALPCSPAPQTSVCASSSVPDLSLTRVGAIDSTTSPVFTSTPRFSSASTVYSRMSGLNIGKISGPASTSVILAVSFRDVRVVLLEDAVVELGQRACGLDAGRAAADDHDVQRAVLDELVLAVGLSQVCSTCVFSRTASVSV